ncbi:MAG: hypothetical protein ACRCYU_17290, partial [Nocardioides sp.]
MTTEAASDQVWVNDYVTSTGIHVAGHWRTRTHSRGETTQVGAEGTGHQIGSAGQNRDGHVASLDVSGSKAQFFSLYEQNARGHGQPLADVPTRTAGEAQRETRVAVGLAALRRRRETLGQQAHLRQSQVTEAADAAQTTSERGRCPKCGEFAGDRHTCSAGDADRSSEGHQAKDRPDDSSIPTNEQNAVLRALTNHERRAGAKGLALGFDSMTDALGYDFDTATDDELEEARRVLADMVDRGALVQHGEGSWSLTPSGRDGRMQAPASSHRCPGCGQFRSDQDGHVCPEASAGQDGSEVAGLPAGSYGDLKGDDRVKAMVADLEESVKAVVESGRLGEWLSAMASNGMNRWSANNRLLAMVQLWQRGVDINDLHLMGFRQWEKFNRKVSKGAKAVWILAPITRRLVEEDD